MSIHELSSWTLPGVAYRLPSYRIYPMGGYRTHRWLKYLSNGWQSDVGLLYLLQGDADRIARVLVLGHHRAEQAVPEIDCVDKS